MSVTFHSGAVLRLPNSEVMLKCRSEFVIRASVTLYHCVNREGQHDEFSAATYNLKIFVAIGLSRNEKCVFSATLR